MTSNAVHFLDWLAEVGSDIGDEEDEVEDSVSRTPSPAPSNDIEPGIGGAHEPIHDLHDLLEVPLQEDGLPAVAPEEIPIELPDHQLDLEDYVINNLAAWLARQHEIFADLVVNPALNQQAPALPRRFV